MKKNQSITFIAAEQKPVFIVSEPIRVEVIIPTDSQAAAKIRAALLWFFAAQIAADVSGNSPKQ